LYKNQSKKRLKLNFLSHRGHWIHRGHWGHWRHWEK